MSMLADRPTTNTPNGPKGTKLPTGRSVIYNPSAEELQELTSRMPNAKKTSFGNYNVQTSVTSRSVGSTYIIDDDPSKHTGQTIGREEAERVAKLQDEYIGQADMLIVDGYIGNDPEHRSKARLYIEQANANIAGMQRQLYFEADAPAAGWDPEFVIIYTPNLAMPGYPDDRLISVDLESGITRVLNSDYFGESKKGGLRMWNAKVYEAGGLAMHAGCKRRA